MTRIDRYILRQVMAPLLITLGIAAMLLSLERMLRIFDFVINQGGPLNVVWQMLGNMVPHYLGLALPIGLFLGVQLAVRKMSTTSELDAVRSVGIGLDRYLRPTMILAVILFGVSILLNGFLQPYSRYAYYDLAFQVRSGALGASIKAGEFTSLGSGLALRIEASRDGGRQLDQLFIRKESDSGRVTTVTARQGSFYATPDRETLVLRLEDGVILDIDLEEPKPRVLTFRTHDFTIPLPTFEDFRARGERTLEMTLDELWVSGRSDGRDAMAHAAAFHTRLARALSLLTIPFLGIGLGVAAKRTNNALGLTVGVMLLLFMHKLLDFSEATTAVAGISPLITVWVPILLFAALTYQLFHVAAYRVGGQPLGPLENVWSRATQTVTALMARLRGNRRWS
ncbi:MAG: LPS export ABC transporter permease LptF [Sphingomonadales bacterium]